MPPGSGWVGLLGWMFYLPTLPYLTEGARRWMWMDLGCAYRALRRGLCVVVGPLIWCPWLAWRVRSKSAGKLQQTQKQAWRATGMARCGAAQWRGAGPYPGYNMYRPGTMEHAQASKMHLCTPLLHSAHPPFLPWKPVQWRAGSLEKRSEPLGSAGYVVDLGRSPRPSSRRAKYRGWNVDIVCGRTGLLGTQGYRLLSMSWQFSIDARPPPA